MSSISEKKNLVVRFVEETWNTGNIDVIDEVMSDTYIAHNPLGEELSKDQLRDAILSMRTTFPDYHITIEDIIGEGDKIVWRWTMNGTDLGGMGDQEPTGNEVEMYGINIELVKDGMIKETWTSSDHTPMEKALNE